MPVIKAITATNVINAFSGTPDGTMFLRDDGTLAAVSGYTKLIASGANGGTLTLYDDTATVGLTTLVIRGGAGQSNDSLLKMGDLSNVNYGVGLFSAAGSNGLHFATSGGASSGQSLNLHAGAFWVESAPNGNRLVTIGTDGLRLNSTGKIEWTDSATNANNGTVDTAILRETTGALAVRSGTTVQDFRVYSTYTDASNYERMGITYTNGVGAWDIRSDVAGTGTNRNLRFFGFVNADLSFRTSTIGVYYPLTIKADFPPECYIRPGTDVMDLGGPSNQWVDLYVGKSYQGGRVKDLEDDTDVGFVRVAVPTAGSAVAGHINYTVAAKDASNMSEAQTGTIYFIARNQAGTVTVTPDGTGNEATDKLNLGSIGTVTFKSSVASTNADIIVNAGTSLTPTAFTITSHVVITSGTAVVTYL